MVNVHIPEAEVVLVEHTWAERDVARPATKGAGRRLRSAHEASKRDEHSSLARRSKQQEHGRRRERRRHKAVSVSASPRSRSNEVADGRVATLIHGLGDMAVDAVANWAGSVFEAGAGEQTRNRRSRHGGTDAASAADEDDDARDWRRGREPSDPFFDFVEPEVPRPSAWSAFACTKQRLLAHGAPSEPVELTVRFRKLHQAEEAVKRGRRAWHRSLACASGLVGRVECFLAEDAGAAGNPSLSRALRKLRAAVREMVPDCSFDRALAVAAGLRKDRKSLAYYRLSSARAARRNRRLRARGRGFPTAGPGGGRRPASARAEKALDAMHAARRRSNAHHGRVALALDLMLDFASNGLTAQLSDLKQREFRVVNELFFHAPASKTYKDCWKHFAKTPS